MGLSHPSNAGQPLGAYRVATKCLIIVAGVAALLLMAAAPSSEVQRPPKHLQDAARSSDGRFVLDGSITLAPSLDDESEMSAGRYRLQGSIVGATAAPHANKAESEPSVPRGWQEELFDVLRRWGACPMHDGTLHEGCTGDRDHDGIVGPLDLIDAIGSTASTQTIDAT